MGDEPMEKHQILIFLQSLGIECELINFDKYEFSRTISFRIYDLNYRIVWFKNESNLIIGDGDRPPQIKFKWMYNDNTYPIVGGNKSIGFSYTRNENYSIGTGRYPYEVFRIPF